MQDQIDSKLAVADNAFHAPARAAVLKAPKIAC
jgi:hypothetical protein